MRFFTFIFLIGLATLAAATDSGWEKAHFNYQMFCQGCHTPDGSGAMSVPRLKGHVGTFLRTDAGREYLVRVPGSATSALDNEELAGVINWIVTEFSGDSLAASFEPYSAQEVGRFRAHPLNEVVLYRSQLLTDIARKDSAHYDADEDLNLE